MTAQPADRRDTVGMRLEFDIDDEDEAIEARDELVDRFATWLAEHPDREADPSDAGLLLDWKRSYGDAHYGRWTVGDVDEVLLDHLPRKLSAPPDLAATIPASLAAFVRFLDDTGLLDRRGHDAERVADRALAQRPSFLEAMANPANFGMAKQLVSSLGFLDAGELPDRESLDAAIAEFNALPDEQRRSIMGGPRPDTKTSPAGPEPGLPPLPLRALPGPEELDQLATEVPLVRQVDALHAAAGTEGIELDESGHPVLSEVRRLVAAVGVDDPVEGISSPTELPHLLAVAEIASAAEAVEETGRRLRAAESWTSLAPGARWAEIVDGVLAAGAATLRFGAGTPSPADLAELADEGALHFLSLLWLAGEPVPLALLADTLNAVSQQADGTEGAAARSMAAAARKRVCRDRIAEMFTTLADAGVAAIDATDGDGEHVTITDGGARLIAPMLREDGYELVLPEELALFDAGEVLDLLVTREADPEVATSLWLDGRSPAEAAEAVVTSLVEHPEPARLMTGFAVLAELGDAAIDAVKASLDTAIAPHAWLLLVAAGAVEPDEMPRDAIVQAGIDLFAAAAELGAPDDAIDLLIGEIPEEEHAAFISDLAGTDHPRTGEILDLIGRHHPAKAVAKHARKTAHRWRSRHGATRTAQR